MRKTYYHAEIHSNKSKSHAAKFITCILVCFAAAFIGFLFTNQSVNGWYLTLKKPFLNPPSWVFGPVWSVLYLCMAIALYKITIKQYITTDVKVAIAFFYVQLVFNVLWSFCFFWLQSPHLALIDISVLWLMILITVFLFFRQSDTAGWLMVPYLLWVSFAFYLNLSIWLLN